MKESTKDKVEGAAHEVKGTVKQKVGHAVGNKGTEAEGIVEKVGGKVEQKVADVKKSHNK